MHTPNETLSRIKPDLDKSKGFAFGKSIDGTYVAFDKPPAGQTVSRSDEELQQVRNMATQSHNAQPPKLTMQMIESKRMIETASVHGVDITALPHHIRMQGKVRQA